MLISPDPHPDVRSLTRKLQVSVGIIGLALVALVITPILFERHTARLRASISTVEDPAREAENDLSAALAREVAAVRGFLLLRDTALIDEYREARAADLSAQMRLELLGPILDTASRRAAIDAVARANEWNALNELLSRGGISADSFVARLGVQQDRYRAALAATGELHDTREAATQAIRARLRAVERVWAMTSLALAVLAIISGFMLSMLLRAVIAERTRAHSDPLTGLLNRRGFRDAANAELARADRHRYPVTLLVIDLDNFKVINDERGHSAGDVVLRNVADALRRVLRATDTPARLGGDEFAVLLAGSRAVEPAAMISKVHERLIGRLVEVECPVTLSIGAVTTDAPFDVAELLAAADRLMYTAKRAGKDELAHIDRREGQLADPR
jgi:diguanylate cyclase (GGDEF)-like protein